MKKKSLPTVVVVGRTNVGKSTLFNRLSVDVKSLTMDYEGVTRDFLSDTVCWQGRCFTLVDTGGISLRKSDDLIAERVRKLGLSLLEKADVLLFVCDGKDGVVPLDRELAQLIHKSGKKTMLLINKMDAQDAQEQFDEFAQLGFSSMIGISAQHGTGIADLLETIVQELPEQAYKKEEEEEEKVQGPKVIILGKPNVGKSSLLNQLLGQERALVADIAGTTREPITEPVRFYQEDILITDTPGVRRKRSVTETLEEMMVKTAMRTLDQADVALLMVDVSAGRISDQELKLAFYAFDEKHKGLILLFNKADLLDEDKKRELAFSLEPYDYFLSKIPQLYISCKTGEHIGKIMPLIKTVADRYHMRITNDELTRIFKEALEHRPLYRQGRLLQLHRAQQVGDGPLSIALFVNFPEFFGPTQFGFFDNIIRKHFDLRGVPVRFFARSRSKRKTK